MRNFLLISAGLLLVTGCNKPPQHQVEMSTPTMSETQPSRKTQPRLKEIRPLDTSQSDKAEPGRGENPPTISEAAKASPPPADDTNLYWVEAGDTYWQIAQKQLGNGHRWKEIEKLNPGVDRTKLKVGQPIRIPKK